jgi:hypothetical protein
VRAVKRDRRAPIGIHGITGGPVRQGTHVATAALVAGLAGACGGGDDPDANVARGRGLRPAALAPAAEAQVYGAALRAAFELEPSLSLLVHPRRLARTAGDSGGAALPPAVIAALRERRVIQGSCEPPLDNSREAPRCAAAAAGYVVRGSDVFLVAPDTVQLHLAGERYAVPGGAPQEGLKFQMAYTRARGGEGWWVVGEARAP